MNIYEKLSELQTEVSVGKENDNEFAKFKYRTIDDIYTAIKPSLKKLKVAITTTDDLLQIGEIYCVKSTIRFVDAEKSEDYIEAQTLVRVDYTRKEMSHEQMTGSAITYAHKYLLGSMLLLSDKDTEDIDAQDNTGLHFSKSESKKTSDAITQEQIDYIKKASTEEKIKMLLDYLKKPSLDKLTKLEAEQVIYQINKGKENE